ncbi:MAG: nitrogenase-stabilizing/protective protein NifW [Epsilonproteobacteria bacterium]|nr:nitrogenase-stabilizing/protective protein NifW [Campylobacterota bacterium]
MNSIEEFKTLTDAEEYFEFFDLEYDERLVYVKRFHILKKFGEMVDRAMDDSFETEEEFLEYYKFALLSVYKSFENGYSPSAAEVWDMFGKPTPCGTCTTSTSCDDIEGVESGAHTCSTGHGLSFN